MNLFNFRPTDPAFRRRWIGYNRSEVDDFVNRTNTELDSLKERLARAEEATPSGQCVVDLDVAAGQARAMLVSARREAEATLAQAERCARRVLQEAAAKARTVRAEGRATQRELHRLSSLRRDVANCLEVSDAALRDAHELLATEAPSPALLPSDSEQMTPATSAGSMRRPAYATDESVFVVPSEPASHGSPGSGQDADLNEAGLDSVEYQQFNHGPRGIDATNILDETDTTSPKRDSPPQRESVLAAHRFAYAALVLVVACGAGLLAWTSQSWTEPVQVGPLMTNELPIATAAPALLAPSVQPFLPPFMSESESEAHAETDGRAEPRPPLAPQGARVTGVDDLVVTLTARRDCWVTVLVDGGQRLDRVIASIETVILHAHEEVSLWVGDAGALSVLIGNEPARPLGSDGEVVDVQITQANHESYLVGPTEGSALAPESNVASAKD